MSKEENIPIIGESLSRADGPPKVLGREKYAADLYCEDLAWAGVKRSGIPHGRIRQIETEDAARIPGVLAILTHKDIRGTNRQGVIRRDQPVLADDKVRHCGDAVALVVAEDRSALKMALRRITLECDPLPAVFDPEEALKEGAPLVHEANPDGNLLLGGELVSGNGEAAFRECHAVVEASFSLPWQEHAYLETEAGLAILREEGNLEIIVSTQTPFRDRAEVAEALGMEVENIHVIAPYCGGAFGGKDGITVQSLLGLAALRCPGKPVKMWWDREESFLAGSKRHPARLHYRLGAKDDGKFHALQVQILYDTGPYDTLGGVVMALGLEHAGGPYRIPHTELKASAVYTNNPIGGAFRGFGVPQVTAAMEQTVDIMAHKLEISPLEIRKRNALGHGDRNPLGVTMTGSIEIRSCLHKVEGHPLWKGRKQWKAAAGPFARRGVGIASVMHGMGYGPVVPDEGNAKLELTDQGKFRIYCGVVDMGQGNATAYLQIAGHILNQPPTLLELVSPDTERTLPSGSASASRTTYTFGNALIEAAQKMKERILKSAGDILHAQDPGEMILQPGRIRHIPTGSEIPLDELVSTLGTAERTSTGYFRAPVSGEIPTEDENLRLHGIPHLLFSFGAHLACVEVDQLTGEVKVKQYLAISDCGKVLNPQLLEQQMHGALAQGLGYALMEDFRVDHGNIQTTNMATYILPTSLDTPDFTTTTVDSWEPTGPFGMKGAGEIAMDGPLPAVANAVADACGVRVFQLPLTPERILGTLNSANKEG
ncbi:xanthine dehydrogenase family protein molybdopterin-binding subunit [Thermodesulfobacteriota bacterium]